ncbi:MAG: helix-turn-helix transcriptional regulator [Candidatus Woesearchaeota archaeon]
MREKGELGIFVFLIFVFLSVSIVSAQQVYNLEVFVNANNIDGFNSRFFIYDFNAQNVTSGSQVVARNNILSFPLYQGFYDISIGIDDPVTSGFDYYGKTSVSVDSNKRVEIDAVPIGSRRIEIRDRNNLPLGDIPVRIDCDVLSGEQKYFRTDSFGIVEASFLPVGKCVFRAAVGDFIIMQNDTIAKGSAKTVVMKFENYSKNVSSVFWIIVVVAILFVVLLAFSYFIFYKILIKKKVVNHIFRRPASVVKKNILENQDVNDVDSMMNDAERPNNDVKNDIMTALNANERRVVSFILEEQEKHFSKNNSHKDFYLHQAKIVYGAGISKTTLVRLLQSLEQKKIIEWERSGKIKKVRLTEWFNSK